MTTQIPNSMLVSPGGGGGAVAVVRIAPTASIPLDTAGNGKAMPLVFGNRIVVSTPLVLIAPLFSAMVDGGNCTGNYRVNATVDDSAFLRSGPPMDIGFDCDVVFVAGIPPRMIVQRGAAVDVTAPLLGAPAIANAAPGFIDTPIIELNSPTLNGVLAGVTLTGFAGKTATAVAVVGNVLRVTLSASAVYGDTGTIAFAAGMVRDTNNNQSIVMAATAVANNIAIPVPGAPVVTAGTNALTSVSGTIAAGAGQVPTSYTLFYKTAAAGTYTTGAFVTYTGASTAFSISGLTAGTSYNVKAQANNAGGASIDSNVITSSTATSGVLSQVAYTPATTKNLTTIGITDWAWRTSTTNLRRKASGVGVVTLDSFGTGTGNSTSGAVTNTISDGVGASFDVADTSNFIAYKNMGDTAPSGWTWTIPIGTTQQTIELEFGGGTGTLTITPTLSDGSATLAPFTMANGGNLGLRFTAKAASAGQSMVVSFSSTTTAGGDFIRAGTMVTF